MTAKKVLVVDDSASVRQEVAETLNGAGFVVVEAVDGIDGIAKLSLDHGFAAVLCDINMPRMNGLEMVEKLQQTGQDKSVAIIMLTTEGQPSLMQRAKKAGAKGWLIKPFKPDVLVATLAKMTQ